MATKVYRVVVRKRADGWGWFPTDAIGRVNISGGVSGYTRKDSAVRGARRACGSKVKIAYA